MQGSMLDWPEWADRTPPGERATGTKFSKSYRETQRELRSLFDAMGVSEWRVEDITGSGGDPGVIIRWKDDGEQRCIACDSYETKTSNIREAYLWLKHSRRQSRRPIQTGRDAFAAAALPDGHGSEGGGIAPHLVLGVSQDAGEYEIQEAFRRRAKEAHPDTATESAYDISDLKRAREALLEGD